MLNVKAIRVLSVRRQRLRARRKNWTRFGATWTTIFLKRCFFSELHTRQGVWVSVE